MHIFSDCLKNGLRLVTVQMPHLHSAEMVCYVGVGGRNEAPESAGISHFVEHMLFRGCEGYPDSTLLERAFEDLGGAVNATTDVETTCFFSRLHPERLEEGAALFASLLRKPLWSSPETERKIILEEAREDWNEQGEMINPDTLTNALLWPDCSLGQPLIGTCQSLEQIQLAQLRDYHERFYTPANTVITLSGRVDHQRALRAVEAAFGDWHGAAPPAVAGVLPRAPEGPPQQVWAPDSSSQLSLQFALQLPWGRKVDESFTMRIWRRILSWGGTSRLMLRLREELGLTYHVEASLNLLDETGSLAIDLSIRPDCLVQVVKEVLAIFREMVDEPVSAEELERTLRNFRYDIDYSRDLPEEMAVRFGWGELVGFRRSLEEDLQAAEAMTAEKLQQLARDILQPGRLALAVIGPWREEDRTQVEHLLLNPF
jgi:predicted Zn-dependent peptidase